jgi:hypothetical protein
MTNTKNSGLRVMFRLANKHDDTFLGQECSSHDEAVVVAAEWRAHGFDAWAEYCGVRIDSPRPAHKDQDFGVQEGVS